MGNPRELRLKITTQTYLHAVPLRKNIRRKGSDVMYIPPFICGFILGLIVGVLFIISWAIWYNRRHK